MKLHLTTVGSENGQYACGHGYNEENVTSVTALVDCKHCLRALQTLGGSEAYHQKWKQWTIETRIASGNIPLNTARRILGLAPESDTKPIECCMICGKVIRVMTPPQKGICSDICNKELKRRQE